MRETLDTLRTYVAYDLMRSSSNGPGATPNELQEQLEALDACVEQAALLWIPRQPPELRRGIGYALGRGIELAYTLGQALAARTAKVPSG
jgi:hypothetical protein